MLSRFTKMVAVAAIVTPLVMVVGATPASATGGATVVGSGTISPGLTTTCTNQTSITFSGTAVVADTVDSGVYTITFSGSSAGCETELNGQGSGTLGGQVSGNVSYTRVGPAVTITGTVTVNGNTHGVTATCVFVPTSIGPIRTYGLVCTVALS